MGPRLSMSSLARSPASSHGPMAGSTRVPRRRHRWWRRATSVARPATHGRARPERAWVDDFLHQLCVFPTGAHDDDVDAFSQLIARCVRPQSDWVTW